ncbi:MAG: glycosyltransferase, partial [Flavobacteriales bacterium]
KLDGMYMGEETFQFLSSCYNVWNDKFFSILLSETSRSTVEALAQKNELPDGCFLLQYVAFQEVPKFLAMADFAFNPQKPLPSKRFGTPVKDGEYWAMGLPVVIHKDISEDSEIVIQERVGAILGDLSHDDNVRIISEITMLIEDSETRSRCRFVAEKYRNFEIALKAYRTVYLETDYPN